MHLDLSPHVLAILPFIFIGALLYTSVGHGGATVYLAILTLAGFAVSPLVTTVLVLNIVAAGIAFFNYSHAGHLRWRLLLPFVLTGVPLAYIGGRLPLSGRGQSLVLGLSLLLAAIRFLFFQSPPRLNVSGEGLAFRLGAPLIGALLGFLAGATGIGGGIFLSPALIVLGWADVRETGNVSSAFIVLNSLAGLAARRSRTPLDAGLLLPLIVVVIAGALLGSFAGARRLPPRILYGLLGTVLLVAAIKTML